MSGPALPRVQIALGQATNGDLVASVARLNQVGTDRTRQVEEVGRGTTIAEGYVVAAAVGLEALRRPVEVLILLDDLPAAKVLRAVTASWSLVPAEGCRPKLVERLRRAFTLSADRAHVVPWTEASRPSGESIDTALTRARELLER